MDIHGVLEAAGVRREDVREVAFCAIFMVGVATVFGLVAPTSMTVMTFATLFQAEDPTGPMLAGFGAVLATGLIVSVVLSVRLTERRWPWPRGPRITRPKRTSQALGILMAFPPILFPILDLSLNALELRLPLVSPDLASGSYFISDNPETWLRVVAPADFAYIAVGGIAGFVAYLAGIVVLLAGWRALRRRHAPVGSAQRT